MEISLFQTYVREADLKSNLVNLRCKDLNWLMFSTMGPPEMQNMAGHDS